MALGGDGFSRLSDGGSGGGVDNDRFIPDEEDYRYPVFVRPVKPVEKVWYKRPLIYLALFGILFGVGLIAIAINGLPEILKHAPVPIKDVGTLGIFQSLGSLQSSDVVDATTTTVYGAELESWQRDTSREYHLSRNGLWDPNQPAQTREYFWNISNVVASPDGVAKNMTLINGKFPGPLVEANEGDEIVVHVRNEADLPTTIHFHGLHQNGTNFMDGPAGITQCPISPGSTFTYKFKLTQYGTYWYHSHIRASYLDGVVGPVVIHSKDDSEAYEYDEEVVIMLSDLYHKDSEQLMKEYMAPNVENNEPVPEAGLINGITRRNCSSIPTELNRTCTDSTESIFPVAEDKIYRFRVISGGGFSEFDFTIDSHTMTVIETDGTITEPYDLHVLRLANAQRYSVLVKMDQKQGAFWMRATMNTYCYTHNNPLLNSDVKAVLSYPDNTRNVLLNFGKQEVLPTTSKAQDLGGSVECIELDSSLLSCKYPQTIPAATQFIKVDSSFQIGAYQIDHGMFNSTAWEPPKYPGNNTFKWMQENSAVSVLSDSTKPDWAENQLIITITERQVVDLVINNYDDGTHPFHIHGHKFWVLDSGPGYFNYTRYNLFEPQNPIIRDTTAVPGFGWSLIRFVADNPGVWAFHCHIVWHSAAGMVMQFNNLPSEALKQKPPQDWHDLCAAQ